jgi:hypothetical protein
MAQDNTGQRKITQESTGQEEEREGSEMREGRRKEEGGYMVSPVSSPREFAST